MSQLHDARGGTWIAIATAASTVLLTAAVASAQAPPPPAAQPAQEETVTSAEVSQSELKQFTKSLEQVLEIQKEVEGKLSAVQEPAKAQQIQQEANAEMLRVIQTEGLEVDRYNVLARSIGQDAELGQRFQEMRKELQEEES